MFSVRTTIAAWLVTAATGSTAAMPDADILRAADRARGAHTDGIEWHVDVTAEEAGRTNSIHLRVQASGFNVLATTLRPASRAGSRMLLTSGSMWFHKPDLSRPVSISQRQKLMGQAAYGDIATTDYAGQYKPERLPDDKMNGRYCYVFDLHADSRQATYAHIRYWVEKERLVGIYAEYYSTSGRLMKIARLDYAHTIELEDGTVQPFCSKIHIEDAITGRDWTSIKLSPPRLRNLPATTFNVDRLGRGR